MEKNTRKNYKQEVRIVEMGAKIPPQATDLECAVLGAIMLERDAFDKAVEIVKAESFYTDAHKKIFQAMVSLSVKNNPIDIMTVAQELISKNELESIGGAIYLTQLTNSVVSSANIETHCRIVAQKFIMRELIRISSTIIGDAYENETDVFDLLDTTDGQITELISSNVKKNYIPIEDGVMQSIERIIRLKAIDSHMTGIPSNFINIDKVTHGWQDTDLIILAARPAVGKTAFALNLARSAGGHFAEQHKEDLRNNKNAKVKSVGFFSLEMSTGQLVNRMISSETEIFLDKISNGRISDEEEKILRKKSIDVLGKLPIYIDDTAGLNIIELRAKCRRLKSKHNVGMIIVDYLQLMSGSERNSNREQEISKISRDLKGLAKELRIPIIALSQLSRDVEKRKGEIKMPQLSDLRESGAIEQDADMVIFLYRPEYYDLNNDEMGESTKGETHVRIAKHRNGSLDTIKLRADLSIQKFYDLDGNGYVSNTFTDSNKWKPISTAITEDNELF